MSRTVHFSARHLGCTPSVVTIFCFLTLQTPPAPRRYLDQAELFPKASWCLPTYPVDIQQQNLGDQLLVPRREALEQLRLGAHFALLLRGDVVETDLLCMNNTAVV